VRVTGCGPSLRRTAWVTLPDVIDQVPTNHDTPDPAGTGERDLSAVPDVTGALVSGIGLRGIDHIGMAVADLDESIEFYQRVFGMRCVNIEDNAEQGVREAMMSVGPDPSGGCLQLLAPLTPDSAIARFLDRSGPGVQQLAYTVDDVDAATAELRSRGVRLLYKTPQSGTAGARINFVFPKDAGGILVELVEPAGSAGSEAAGSEAAEPEAAEPEAAESA
jgi:methylmalonyl-CoA/ethylmalonyl-CoA epimerase